MSGRGATVLVTRVGEAAGAREIGAAISCAGAEPDRAGLLIELAEGPAPRPALVATAAARALEQRLTSHLPTAAAAARGRVCHLATSADEEGLEATRAARPLARDAACVLIAPPALAERALDLQGLKVDAAVVRADLGTDRALAALAVRGLMARGLRVAVAKRPLPWTAARLALFGAATADQASSRISLRVLDGPR